MAFVLWALVVVMGLCVPGTARAAEQDTATAAVEYFANVKAFVSDSRWASGTAWGARGPKLSTWGSSGCFAYAADFTTYMYGVASPEHGTKFTSASQIRTGDTIRISGLGSSGHTVVVLERNGSNMWTAEGNYYTSSGKVVRIADPGYVVSGGKIYQVWTDGSRHAMTFLYGHHFVNVGSYTRTSVASIKSLASATVSAVGKHAYTGSAITPAPTVTYEGATLTQGADYTLSYKNNVNAGTATITIQGIGAYSGTQSVTFRITKRAISAATVSKVAAKLYTGHALTPKPKVVFAGTRLTRGTDYKLTYKNNKNEGTATVFITGKGNFTGTRKVKFKILGASVTYSTYVHGGSWQGWKTDGKTSGATSGAALNAVRLKPVSNKYSGSILYRSCIRGKGWETSWRKNGRRSGSTKRCLEAVRIKLSGQLARKYNVYYRVYSSTSGWQGWAKNGAKAGTKSETTEIKALQVVLVAKGKAAPGATALAYVKY